MNSVSFLQFSIQSALCLSLSGIINIAMKIEIPSYVSVLMNVLNENGYECFIVGGAVRSALLSLPVHDYDLTTNALPVQMKEVFHDFRTIETGIQHGTLTVMSDHHPVEITTYRKDAGYSDHRHPDRVEFTDALKEDCARRDFTINAMACGTDGKIHDFFNGREDLENRLIRCIGIPQERFDEDALRILRALRFAARLGFSIDEKTSDALLSCRALLNFISMERIRDELMGLLEAPGAPALFEQYIKVFETIIPELKDCPDTEKEVMFRRLANSVTDPLIRVALILCSLRDPAQIMKRMKFSNHETDIVMNLLNLKERNTDTSSDIRRIIRDLKTEFERFARFVCAMDESKNYAAIMKMHEDIINAQQCCTLRQLAVKGNDLVQAGLKGRQISEALDLLLEEVIDMKLPNDRTALLDYLKQKEKADCSASE